MSACEHFTQNAWRPDLCSTCQRAKSEHGPLSGPRSWRRKSEPNPHNAISGVRISALASKFQSTEARNGNSVEAEPDRATTLDRKTKSRTNVLNTSRSTELLDAPASLSSSASSPSSALPNSVNRATDLRSETLQTKIERLKSKNATALTAVVPQPSTSSVSATTHISTVVTEYSDKGGAPSATGVRSKQTSSVVKNSLGITKTSLQSSSSGTVKTSVQSFSSGISFGTTKTSLLSSSSGANLGTAKTSVQSSSIGTSLGTAKASVQSSSSGTSLSTTKTSVQSSSSGTSLGTAKASVQSSSSGTSLGTVKASVQSSSSGTSLGTAKTSVQSSSSGTSLGTTRTSVQSSTSGTSLGTTKSSALSCSSSTSLGTTKTPVLSSSNSKDYSTSSSESSATSVSSSTAAKSSHPLHPDSESAKKASTTQASTKHPAFVKIQHTDVIKELISSKKKQPKWKEKRRVSIPEREPDIIGNDGGLGNVFLEDEVVSEGDSERIYWSLTDEEKQFALLALGNTLWNSDNRNLQVEADVSKKPCKEFEDVDVDQLWSKSRFKSLVTCDPVIKKKDFGTFPQTNTSKPPKMSIGNLTFVSQGKKGQEVNKTRSFDQKDAESGITVVDSKNVNGQCRAEYVVEGNSKVEILKSGPESRVSGTSRCAATGSGLDMAPCNESVLSNTGNNSVHKSHDGPKLTGDRKAQNTTEKDSSDNSNTHDTSSSQLTNLEKNQDFAMSSELDLQRSTVSEADVAGVGCGNESLTDMTIQEGFQAVALLNEVLRGYGDFNESSTDDCSMPDTKKDKKSMEFEARMASVAAALDLTKQQRGKRQAPRPSVSPPPEPSLSEGVSPKKVVNQPEPVFKMVPVGKSIVTLPPQQDALPKNTKPALVSYGLEDFGSLSESPDNTSSRTPNGDGRNKKGITSFFRNILRRGKDSSDNGEFVNPDVQLNVKMDRKDSTGTVVSMDLPDEGSFSAVDQKTGPKFSPQAKLVLGSASREKQHSSDGELLEAVKDGDSESQTEPSAPPASSSSSLSSSAVVVSESSAKASPPTQRKTSAGLASPKMMLKKATAKFSPPVSRHVIMTQEKEQESSSSSAKQYPAPKPSVPPPAKPLVASVASEPPGAAASSSSSAPASEVSVSCEKESTTGVVRRRPKSPKRTAPPVPPPTRTSGGSGGGTLSRSELRESTRRSLPVPPSPPGERKASLATGASTPPVSPIKETLHSLPSSPSSPALSSFDFANTEWSGGSTSTIDDDLPAFSEKIELPTVATQGRKGLLGKLGANRKSRAPQPPSVKRAKSITQSATLPRGDKKSKKINAADISAPVLVTGVSNCAVLENRRNTISLGDEPAFISLSTSALHTGSTNSSASVDKSGLDEFDIPVLSPLGSLENLYESILPKPEGNLLNFYDPPTSPKVVCPNVTSDGYLEPVPPLSSAAAVISSSLPSLLETAAANSLTSSSSLASASCVIANTSIVKSPLVKPKASSSRTDRPADVPPHSKESGIVSHGSTSSDSIEVSSSENSGNSLPDSTHVSPWNTLVKGGGNSSGSSGLGPSFVEPEMTEERRLLLASQPIYEEIPNGDDEVSDYEDDETGRGKEVNESVKNLHTNVSSRSTDDTLSLRKAVLPEVSRNQMAQTWLQQQQPRIVAAAVPAPPPAAVLPTPSPSLPSNATTAGVLLSPSHSLSKQNSAPASSSSMSSSQIMSSLMTTSLTSSMLPPPPPPPDHSPARPTTASRSVSKETVSSESDSQSVCSNETQSNNSTLSRPRPVPRQKPKRPDTGGSDQYVSMNKPNAQVSLSEDMLRDVFTKLTSITFHALQDIYAQFEKIVCVDKLEVPNSKMLKWVDFDIYGQPLHASGRCVVYNAKLKTNSCPCQVLILHSRPATEMCTSTHPSLLRPNAVFADTIPFSYLTPDFIKTSQLLQNSVYDSSQARCFVAIGAFNIVESLDSHLVLLRETMAQDLNSYLHVVLTAALQLLSAMSHCLDQGFSVTETDYDDVFLITRPDLRGKVVAFLPRQRSLDVPQGEAICNFLDRLLVGNMPSNRIDGSDDDDDVENDNDVERMMSKPQEVVLKLRSLLGQRKVECLGQLRTTIEYLLWGPSQSELPLLPAGVEPKPTGKISAGAPAGASKEQELYVWLEKERLLTVAKLAQHMSGLEAGLSLEEFYTLKFLLKTSPGCLAESLRRLSR